MADPILNLAFSTVSVAPSPAASGTTLTPVSASRFPDPDDDGAFNVTVGPADATLAQWAAAAEIIRVTSSAAGVWTISRAAEGPNSARSIQVGDEIILGPTEATFDDVIFEGDSRLTDSRAPSGAAGGVLSGTYPNPGFAADMATQAELDAHAADTTSVHGIADTSVLETVTGSAAKVSAHEADTTNVHGITDTSALETTTGSAAKVAAHEADTTNVHGIADTSVLETTSGAQSKVNAGVALAAILAPDASARNVIQPSSASVVPLTLKGAAAQSADLFKITNSADATLGHVTAAGQLSVGGPLVTDGYSAGHQVLQVRDVGLTEADEAMIEVFAPNQRGGIHFYNLDDNFGGFYPWFWMLNEYNSTFHIGSDKMAFWYGLHTPDAEPAQAIVFFSRNGDSVGWQFGTRAETYADAVTNDLEFFFIDEGGASVGSYPLRLYPGQRWRIKASLLEDANLSAGEFSWGVRTTPGDVALLLKIADDNGDFYTATIPATAV